MLARGISAPSASRTRSRPTWRAVRRILTAIPHRSGDPGRQAALLAKASELGEEDTLLLFYCGHGAA